MWFCYTKQTRLTAERDKFGDKYRFLVLEGLSTDPWVDDTEAKYELLLTSRAHSLRVQVGEIRGWV